MSVKITAFLVKACLINSYSPILNNLNLECMMSFNKTNFKHKITNIHHIISRILNLENYKKCRLILLNVTLKAQITQCPEIYVWEIICARKGSTIFHVLPRYIFIINPKIYFLARSNVLCKKNFNYFLVFLKFCIVGHAE